jgi:methyl-accepting chemotaxis protein
MGLFDMFKDKAAELIQTAKDQVNDLTGIDLPAAGETIAEQTQQATEQVSDIAGNHLQPDTLINTATDSIADAGQNAADTAHDAVNNATDKLTGQ